MAFDNPLAGEIWSSKYRFNPAGAAGEETVEGTWSRVAAALAEAEVPDLPVLTPRPEALDGATYKLVWPESALVRKEGCDSCLSCGYSKCGWPLDVGQGLGADPGVGPSHDYHRRRPPRL